MNALFDLVSAQAHHGCRLSGNPAVKAFSGGVGDLPENVLFYVDVSQFNRLSR